MASKDMKISISPDQVVFTNISRSKDGYNSARIVAKMNEKEYMSVSYEWEGNTIPDFAMNLMGFMQANELEVGKEYEPQASAKCGGGGSKKKMKKKKKASEGETLEEKIDDKTMVATAEKTCPKCKKAMSKCTCDEDMEDE